jgi:hypothetical protein
MNEIISQKDLKPVLQIILFGKICPEIIWQISTFFAGLAVSY